MDIFIDFVALCLKIHRIESIMEKINEFKVRTENFSIDQSTMTNLILIPRLTNLQSNPKITKCIDIVYLLNSVPYS